MLVLSRKQNDKIVFPHLGITVEILKIGGRSVRIGVDAPANVRVLRHELSENVDADLPPPSVGARMSEHTLRNRLNRASLGLQLAQRQLEVGVLENAEETISRVLADFQSLDEELSQGDQPPACTTTGRALLVEDDPNESELLAGFLRLSGFTVDTAVDGCDALDYLSGHHQPDVILLDMHMPRCDGPATISAIRDNPQYQGLKVYAVSGRVPAEVGVTVGPTGVDRWFRKPLNPHKLVTELKRELALAAT